MMIFFFSIFVLPFTPHTRSGYISGLLSSKGVIKKQGVAGEIFSIGRINKIQ